MSKPVFALPLLLLMAGCATMTQGTSQEIAIVTPEVQGARCIVSDTRGSFIARLESPGRVRVPKARRDLEVRCDKSGFQTGVAAVKPSYAARARVQMPLGYAVDGLSGAMWAYPTEVTVTLTPEAAG
jgi:hypothetical protein